MLVVCLLFAAPVRAQDNPSDNADLKEFLKQVAEMQKKATGSQTQNVPAFDADKKVWQQQSRPKGMWLTVKDGTVTVTWDGSQLNVKSSATQN